MRWAVAHKRPYRRAQIQIPEYGIRDHNSVESLTLIVTRFVLIWSSANNLHQFNGRRNDLKLRESLFLRWNHMPLPIRHAQKCAFGICCVALLRTRSWADVAFLILDQTNEQKQKMMLFFWIHWKLFFYHLKLTFVSENLIYYKAQLVNSKIKKK